MTSQQTSSIPVANVVAKETRLGASAPSRPPKKPQPRRCKFFVLRRGCRAGEACVFLHQQDRAPTARESRPRNQQTEVSTVKEDSAERGPEGENVEVPGSLESESVGAAGVQALPANQTQRPRKQKERARRPRTAGGSKVGGDMEAGRAADACRKNVPTNVAEVAGIDPPTKTAPPPKAANDPPLQARRRQPAVSNNRPAVSRPPPRSLEERLASTTDPILQASLTRALDLEKLERRFRASGYKLISSTKISAIIGATVVPSDPDFPYDLPGLELEITIPASYPLTPASISVKNTEIPAPLKKGIEKAWLKKAAAAKVGILAMINWLDRQLEELLIEKDEPAEAIRFVRHAKSEKPIAPRELSLGVMPAAAVVENVVETSDGENTSWTEDSDPDAETNSAPVTANAPFSAVSQHRGLQIRLPLIRLVNIALLQCLSLNIVVRCSRCKNSVDILNLLPDAPQPRWTACPQCNSELGVRHRGTPLHPAAPSLGYLDLEMCTAYDLLPSNYIATCGSCATPQASSGGFRAVIRGYPTEMRCHTCNTNMTLGIDDVKFVNLQPTSLPHNAGLKLKRKQRKAKDDVALVIGTPLPRDGTCTHYRQSYRWFRFPCCGKLFPCDECHAAAAGATCAPDADSRRPRLATRVVCGFCSRESAYAPSVLTCTCGKAMVRERHRGGFWEGGKGTRDRQRMNRNDPRKFAGLSKTVSMKSARVGKKHDG
ncbi:hypothetical protein HDU87_005721 [Geranomyces variabilis]|uniref:Uncharacterized protein n=1 Tax=Geranomyces variabilis TaxID=109894 RepID=A0AAD5TGI8_9FUNG|nr:hypothetical protein HDU87_005721 [Geranomyces variabilis]